MPMQQTVRHPFLGTVRMIVFITVVSFWLVQPMMKCFMYQRTYRLRDVITAISLEGLVDNTGIKKEDLPPSMQSNSEAYIKIYNVEECVIPYQGIGPSDGIFVITNFAITNNKSIGLCPEDPLVLKCNDDDDCKDPSVFPHNGIITGRCVQNDIQQEVKTCEIKGWCPITRRTAPMKNGRAILEKVGNMRITIHSLGVFEGTDWAIHNIQQVKDVLNGSSLERCLYSAKDNVMRYCPRFSIEDTVMQAEGTRPNETFSSIALKGAVITIRLMYDCNLDTLPLENCHPTYSIHRQDNVLNNDVSAELRGISQSLSVVNYHSATIKTVGVYDGIRFLVDLEGRARRTELKSMWTSIGLLFSWMIVVLKMMPYMQKILLRFYCFLKDLLVSIQEYFLRVQARVFRNNDEDEDKDDDAFLP